VEVVAGRDDDAYVIERVVPELARCFLALLLGAYHGWLAWRRRRAFGAYGWFAGVMALQGLDALLVALVRSGGLEGVTLASYRLPSVALGASAAVLTFVFLWRFLEGRLPPRRWGIALGVAGAIVVVRWTLAVLGVAPALWNVLDLAGPVLGVLCAWTALSRAGRHPDARVIAAGYAVVGLEWVVHWLFHIDVLPSLGPLGHVQLGQPAVAIAMAAALARRLVRSHDEQEALLSATDRFVPVSLLHRLGRDDLRGVRLGDATRARMTVVFADLRGFTTRSEGLTPEQSLAFVNRYLKRVVPAIYAHGGVVGSYLGDGILALHSGPPLDALRACLAQLEAVRRWNAELEAEGERPVAVGYGVHTGEVMLGTVGDETRLACTVIGDSVNLSARVESLTSRYGARVLLTGESAAGLPQGHGLSLRAVGSVRVKGKGQPVALYELLDADEPALAEVKRAHLGAFESALTALEAGHFAESARAFAAIAADIPGDRVSAHLAREALCLVKRPPEAWEGVLDILSK